MGIALCRGVFAATMRRTGWLSWLLLTPTVSACYLRPSCDPQDVTVDIEVLPLAASPRVLDSRVPESVSVVVTPPPRPFVETALLDARLNHAHCGDKSDIVGELRRVAAHMGCDLLVVYSQNDAVWVNGRAAGSAFVYHAACGVYSDGVVSALPRAS